MHTFGLGRAYHLPTASAALDVGARTDSKRTRIDVGSPAPCGPTVRAGPAISSNLDPHDPRGMTRRRGHDNSDIETALAAIARRHSSAGSAVTIACGLQLPREGPPEVDNFNPGPILGRPSELAGDGRAKLRRLDGGRTKEPTGDRWLPTALRFTGGASRPVQAMVGRLVTHTLLQLSTLSSSR